MGKPHVIPPRPERRNWRENAPSPFSPFKPPASPDHAKLQQGLPGTRGLTEPWWAGGLSRPMEKHRPLPLKKCAPHLGISLCSGSFLGWGPIPPPERMRNRFQRPGNPGRRKLPLWGGWGVPGTNVNTEPPQTTPAAADTTNGCVALIIVGKTPAASVGSKAAGGAAVCEASTPR